MSDPETPTPTPSRRQVVRTAAHVAWAAPVVVAASGAPAYAAGSGGQAQMTVTMSEPLRLFGNVPVTAGILNQGTGATSVLRVHLDLVCAPDTGDFSTSTSTTPAGFAAPVRGPTPPGMWTKPSVRFTYVALAQMPANSGVPFEVNLTLTPVLSSGVIWIQAEPGGTGISGSDQADFA